MPDELGEIEPSNLNYTSLESTFDRVIGRRAPIKKKHVLANDNYL